MTLQDMKKLGGMIMAFLCLFRGCFPRLEGYRHCAVYVKGQLSDLHRKNCEAIAIEAGVAPRTLQRFVESIKWNEELVRDRCIEIVVKDHAHPEAIGLIDESGTTKSGKCTAGVGRQYNGNRGKIENCTVGVHLGYWTPQLMTILDSRLYLPEDWANDPRRRKQNYIPDDIEFQTKQQIALGLIRHALKKGLKVRAWTFDELYGRDNKFLDGLDDLGEGYVAEIPVDTELWTSKPSLTRRQPVKREKRGRKRNTPRIVRSRPACEVRNLIRYSSKFQKQAWQRYRIKDTAKGPEVWEVKWLHVWRKTQDKLPSRQQTLIVAHNVRTGEIKFFLSNMVVGRKGVTLRRLLRIAFGRWAIEACFRTAKEELGMDHFEVRGWRCIHRHYYLTGMSYLLCGRIREKLGSAGTGELTVEQVRQCINTYLTFHHLPTEYRDREFEKALDHQHYYQIRNTKAKNSHTKTRRQLYAKMGIDVDKIKSCVLHPPTNETQ